MYYSNCLCIDLENYAKHIPPYGLIPSLNHSNTSLSTTDSAFLDLLRLNPITLATHTPTPKTHFSRDGRESKDFEGWLESKSRLLLVRIGHHERVWGAERRHDRRILGINDGFGEHRGIWSVGADVFFAPCDSSYIVIY